MPATFQLHICGPRTFNDDEQKLLQACLGGHFLCTSLDNPTFHIAHTDMSAFKNQLPIITIDLIHGTQEQERAWNKISHLEGKKSELVRGLKDLQREISRTLSGQQTKTQKHGRLKRSLRTCFTALTRKGYSHNYAFIEILKHALRGTTLSGARIHTGTASEFAPSYKKTTRPERSHAQRKFPPYQRSPRTQIVLVL